MSGATDRPSVRHKRGEPESREVASVDLLVDGAWTDARLAELSPGIFGLLSATQRELSPLTSARRIPESLA